MKLSSYPNLFTVFAITLVLTANSCGKKIENKTQQKQTYLTGRYVNNTILTQIADTIPAGVPSYCLELNFTMPDSVGVSFGFEEGNLAYKKEGDHYTILQASSQGNMFFLLNADSSITLVDSAWTEVATNSIFKKVPNDNGKKWVFEKYINEALVVGEYTLYKNNQPTEQKVSFTSDGKVGGLENYTEYGVCYAGDCVGTTVPLSNIISLVTKQGEFTNFAFKLDKKKNTLQLFALELPKEDIKGEQKIKELVFDLRK